MDGRCSCSRRCLRPRFLHWHSVRGELLYWLLYVPGFGNFGRCLWPVRGIGLEQRQDFMTNALLNYQPHNKAMLDR